MRMDARLDVDHRELEVRTGDGFPLTMDGVHDWLDEATLHRLL